MSASASLLVELTDPPTLSLSLSPSLLPHTRPQLLLSYPEPSFSSTKTKLVRLRKRKKTSASPSLSVSVSAAASTHTNTLTLTPTGPPQSESSRKRSPRRSRSLTPHTERETEREQETENGTEREDDKDKPWCRYGAGCTHISDAHHREKFRHPAARDLTDEELRSHFVCNECGFATPSLETLRVHLQRKTAWSNASLVGCRVHCLLDGREWCEGVVTQFHQTSHKHRVEFLTHAEPRWLSMRKIAFYIMQRALITSDAEEERALDNESKEPWDYNEPISLSFAFAQSCLFKICGQTLQETGHHTRGHRSLSVTDRERAVSQEASLLYGELLPRGVHKALMSGDRLAVCERDARVLCDLGMGTAKVVLQAFVQCRSLTHCYGVELSQGRYRIAEEAALRLVDLLGRDRFTVRMQPGRFLTLTEHVVTGTYAHMHTGESKEVEDGVEGLRVSDAETERDSPTHKDTRTPHAHSTTRVLHIECGDMFECVTPSLLCACDVLMLETDIPIGLHASLHNLLTELPLGARILSYLDLDRCMSAFNVYTQAHSVVCLRQVEANRSVNDRYATSWSVQRGHHFFLWEKVAPHELSSLHASLSLTPPSDNENVRVDTDCLPFSLTRALSRCLSLCSVSSSRVTSPVKPLQTPIIASQNNSPPQSSESPPTQALPLSREDGDNMRDRAVSDAQESIEQVPSHATEYNNTVVCASPVCMCDGLSTDVSLRPQRLSLSTQQCVSAQQQVESESERDAERDCVVWCEALVYDAVIAQAHRECVALQKNVFHSQTHSEGERAVCRLS